MNVPSSLERSAARNLVARYLRVKPDENVVVEAWDHTLPMSTALVDEVRRVGGRAFLAYEPDEAWWRSVERGQTKRLGRLSDPEWAAIAAANVYLQFWGPADSARLERLGDSRVDEWGDGWFQRWYSLARTTGLRGGRMAVGWVTESRARHWGVNAARWRSALLEGCLADPEEMAQSGRRLAGRLVRTKTIRITHPNGTDLEVAPARAPPRVYEGYPHPADSRYSEYDMLGNFPDGRLRLALDSATAEGSIVSNRPSYDEVWFPWATYSGGTFRFAGGRLTSFRFGAGRARFARNYARGSPGKDRTGSLLIGLNPKLRDAPYVEDSERGAVQLSIGGNTYSGGHNASDFRGSVTLAGAEVQFDGTPVVRSGRIL